jgi:hypothetical protein
MTAADPLLAMIDDVLRAAAKLPACDGAAKLHALVARVLGAIEQRQDPASSIEALARGAAEALEHDPWVQFERAAGRLRAAAPATALQSVSALTAPPVPPA